MSIGVDQGFAALLGASLGGAIALLVAQLNYQQKEDELFFKALDFLGGGSQKRNLGIAAIELYWQKRRHRNICIPLLIGSAIYLLLESEQERAAHEVLNLQRTMTLLTSIDKLTPAQKPLYRQLRKAVSVKRRGKAAHGLSMKSKHLKQELKKWECKLNSLLGPQQPRPSAEPVPGQEPTTEN